MNNFDLKSYLKNNPLLTEGIDLPSTYSPERDKEYEKVIQRQIQDYIKGGSKGSLYLGKAPITSLPDKLTKVGGGLNLENTPIASLPDNLEVGSWLNLERTEIASLPNNLKVGWNLSLYNTPLSGKHTKEEIRKMIEEKGGYVKGDIYL